MRERWKRPWILVPLVAAGSFVTATLVLAVCVLVDDSNALAEWYCVPGTIIDAWLLQNIAGYANSLERFGGDYFLWGFPVLIAVMVWAGAIAIPLATALYWPVARRRRSP